MDLRESVCQFLNVCLHSLLYERHVYPADIFERRHAYSTPIRYSRHPTLQNYLQQLTVSIHEWMKKQTKQKIVIALMKTIQKRQANAQQLTAFFSSSSSTQQEKDFVQIPFERFVFDVQFIANNVAASSTASAASSSSSSSSSSASVSASVSGSSELQSALQSYFHSSLFRLLNACTALTGDARGCTFTVLLYTNEKPESMAAMSSSSGVSMGWRMQDWVGADPHVLEFLNANSKQSAAPAQARTQSASASSTSSSSSSSSSSLPSSSSATSAAWQIHPIRSIVLPLLRLDFYVEENLSFKRMCQDSSTLAINAVSTSLSTSAAANATSNSNARAKRKQPS
jgi:hypothetical protein